MSYTIGSGSARRNAGWTFALLIDGNMRGRPRRANPEEIVPKMVSRLESEVRVSAAAFSGWSWSTIPAARLIVRINRADSGNPDWRSGEGGKLSGGGDSVEPGNGGGSRVGRGVTIVVISIVLSSVSYLLRRTIL